MHFHPVVTSARNPQFKALLKRITSSKGPWYHKHFHGNFFFLYFVGEGIFHFPTWSRARISHSICFSDHDNLEWFWDVQDLARGRNILLEEGQHPSFIRQVRRVYAQQHRAIFTCWQRAMDQDLTKLSDRQLLQLFLNYREPYFGIYSIGGLAEYFLTTGEHDWFEDLIEDEIRGKISVERIAEIVSVLAAPIAPSAVNREHASLLAVGVAMMKDARVAQALRHGSVAAALKLVAKKPRLHSLLTRHTKEFFWIENSYFPRPPLDELYFIEKLMDFVRSGISLPRELAKEKGRTQYHIQQKQKAIKRFRLSRRLRNIITLSDLLTEVHDSRKEFTLRSNAFLQHFLTEVGRRKGISFTLLVHSLPRDIVALLQGKKVPQRDLAARRSGAIYGFSARLNYVVLARDVPGVTVKKFYQLEKKDQELRGVVASRGHGLGKVRVIVDTGKLKEFKTGEILVTNNTTPEFVPAMRKAAAIITEQGGLTTHAAIVSRELGVPCVIGVTNVTQHLKTGDRVEVDAIQGIVKKIS